MCCRFLLLPLPPLSIVKIGIFLRHIDIFREIFFSFEFRFFFLFRFNNVRCVRTTRIVEPGPTNRSRSEGGGGGGEGKKTEIDFTRCVRVADDFTIVKTIALYARPSTGDGRLKKNTCKIPCGPTARCDEHDARGDTAGQTPARALVFHEYFLFDTVSVS